VTEPAAGCCGSWTPRTDGVGNQNRNTDPRCCWCSGHCNRCRPPVGRMRPTARYRSADNWDTAPDSVRTGTGRRRPAQPRLGRRKRQPEYNRSTTIFNNISMYDNIIGTYSQCY